MPLKRLALAFVAVGAATAGLAPALAADPAAGRAKAAMCQPCHGIDGIAKIPDAPNIAGENALYLQSQLKAFRTGKRVQEMMSVIAKQLSDDDIANVAAWYASIKVSVDVPD